MKKVKLGKEPKEWKKAVDLGSAFELVDRVNEHARLRSSLFAHSSG